MKIVFVDSNVFLRLFTGDDAEQCERAAKLLQSAADGVVQLVTGPPVLFEVAWTLAGSYHRDREKILLALRSILSHSGLRVTDAGTVRAALTLAQEKGMSFPDAYVAALAESAGATELATFNRKHFEGLIDLYPLE